MKGAAKVAKPKEGLRRSSTARRKSQLAGEAALAEACQPLGILGEFARPNDGQDVGEDIGEVLQVPEEGSSSFTPESETSPEAEAADEGEPPTNGFLGGPFVQRLREEAAQRAALKALGRKSSARRDFGPEFQKADAEVKRLKAELATVRSEVQAVVGRELSAEIRNVRDEIKAARGAGMEGLLPLNNAITEARELLRQAKEAKQVFLAEHGVSATDEGEGPNLREQLKELRSRKQAALEGVDASRRVALRAALKAAKVARAEARNKALKDAATRTEVFAAGESTPAHMLPAETATPVVPSSS